MIICSRCNKENQDHFKFCLGCGAKLAAPSAASVTQAAAKPPSEPQESAKAAQPVAPVISAAAVAKTAAPFAPTPGGPSPALSEFARSPSPSPSPSAPASSTVTPPPIPTTAPIMYAAATTPPPVAVHAPVTVICAGCGKTIAANFAFCGSCGFRLKSATDGVAAAGTPAPKAAVVAPTPAKPLPRGHLTLIRPDGSEGGMHPLQQNENLVGRGQGSLFDADPYLSPRHAEFILGEDGLTVRDLKSLNGVFIRIAQEERLESGDIFRIGQELLRFDVIAPATALEDGTEIIGTPNPGFWGRISVIVGRDVDGPAFPLFDEAIVLGRERGDILFLEDGYVSGTHSQLTVRDGQVYLSDLGSSNGTFFRIRGSRVIPSGSLMLLGQQLFRASFE